ncbi:MAG: DNA glycosylase AlkZ-like family protein [Candidatus Heimdallarchaeota archaeon]
MKITNEQSRVLHLNSLMLWEGPGKIKALDVIKKLSYLQIDAIYSIARSQDIVLHNRTTSYQEKDVWKLLEEKKLFEGFAHARCLLPIDDLPYYYTKMLRRRESVPQWYRSVSEELDWQTEILETAKIKKEISVKDITIPENFPKFTGWNQAPKRMLDYLSTRGYLFSSKREKFQSFYKLPELQFKNFDTIVSNLPSREEEFLFHIKSTLRATGPSPLHRLLHYKYIHSSIELNGKKISPRTLVSKYIKDGTLTEIKVEGNNGKHVTYVCLPDQSDMITDLPQKDQDEYNCFFLSPFDNALWSRESLFAQYNFDYKMEVYVPKIKRIYGFFTMPILFGPDFVGRVDVKLERKDGTFHFLKWSLEKNFKQMKSIGYFWKELTHAIERITLFHKVSKVDLGNLSSTYKNKIQKLADIKVS